MGDNMTDIVPFNFVMFLAIMAWSKYGTPRVPNTVDNIVRGSGAALIIAVIAYHV